MSSHIDFRVLPQNLPSLCIPRVFPNIDEPRIRRIFNDLALGDIDRIDLVSTTTQKGEKFNRVFVHFRRWFANNDADVARERLLNGKDIKIVYDDPWFWKVSAYRPPVHKEPAPPQKFRPHIEFDAEDRPHQQQKQQHQQQKQQKQEKDDFGRDINMRSSSEPAVAAMGPSAEAPKMVPRSVAMPVNQRRIIHKKKPQEKTVALKVELEEGEIEEN